MRPPDALKLIVVVSSKTVAAEIAVFHVISVTAHTAPNRRDLFMIPLRMFFVVPARCIFVDGLFGRPCRITGEGPLMWVNQMAYLSLKGHDRHVKQRPDK